MMLEILEKIRVAAGIGDFEAVDAARDAAGLAAIAEEMKVMTEAATAEKAKANGNGSTPEPDPTVVDEPAPAPTKAKAAKKPANAEAV
jgi:hypothetical protein